MCACYGEKLVLEVYAEPKSALRRDTFITEDGDAHAICCAVMDFDAKLKCLECGDIYIGRLPLAVAEADGGLGPHPPGATL